MAGVRKNGNWIFAGLFLTEESRNEIMRYIKFGQRPMYDYMVDNGWVKYIDHVTFAFNDGNIPEESVREYENAKGRKFSMEVIGIGFSDNAVALEMEPLSSPRCYNEHCHITVAVAPGHRPAESNMITDWRYLHEPFFVEGIFGIRRKGR